MSWKDDLKSKYPELLGEVRGIECGKGWAWLIDALCEKIDDYVKSSEFISKFSETTVTINNGNIKSTALEPDKIPKVKVSYIKEKLGILDFFVDNADDKIWNYIGFAAIISTKTCEECGTHKYMGKTSGWVRHLCKDCGEKDRNPWEPDKDYTAEIRAEKLKNIEGKI